MTTGTCAMAIASTLMLAALVPGPLSAQQPADTFYCGGDILTMEDKVPRHVEALAVRDGTIDEKTLDRQHKRCGVPPGAPRAELARCHEWRWCDEID